MSPSDALRALLERLVPRFHESEPDWTDVLLRASAIETPRRRPLRRYTLAAAATVAAFLGLAASPIGQSVIRGSIDRFSAWTGGEPGRPAPPSAQLGFEAQNEQSYARFPESTELRLLLRQRLAGREFQLLGFRDHGSLCLRVVRADLPDKRAATSCLPPEQVAAPAVVAGFAGFRVGNPTLEVSGIYGLAADGVRAVEVVQERSGPGRALLGSNAFLYLRARPTGTVADPPPADPILDVYAREQGGRRQTVHFVSRYGIYPRSLRGRPSFMTWGTYLKPEQLPGPAKAVRRPRASIGWVRRRERRGEPLAPPGLDRSRARLGTFEFARAIRPDPQSSFRVGIFLNGSDLCLQELYPLSRGIGFGCSPLAGAFERGPLLLGGLLGTSDAQATIAAGLASDAVASIALYLRTGERRPVPLKDNAFASTIAVIDLPAKLVAYDAAARPIGVEVLTGPGRVRPCPEPRFPKQPPSTPRLLQRLDLGARTLGGAQVLGRRPGVVRRLLGPPARDQRPNRPDRAFHYGRLRVHQGPIRISFRPRRHRQLRAVSVSLADPDIVEARIGRILRMHPLAAQRAIERLYGDRYKLVQAYGSSPGYGYGFGGGCVATFDLVGTNRHLTIGMYRPHWRPFLMLWRD